MVHIFWGNGNKKSQLFPLKQTNDPVKINGDQLSENATESLPSKNLKGLECLCHLELPSDVSKVTCQLLSEIS